jgi:hypothetical protein
MKEYEEISIVETKEIPKSITCNRCGKHEKLTGDEYTREFQTNLYQTFYPAFGYGSKLDMDRWTFDLCEECLIDFVRTFKHLPEGYDKTYIDKVFKK